MYVEGGGSRRQNRQCRKAFRAFMDKAGVVSAKIEVEARGARGEAYKAFRDDSDRDIRRVLLVDAEGPVSAKTAWGHLQQRDGWNRPRGVSDSQCHLMVQMMESWFLADVDALEGYFGRGFRSGALPGNPDVEKVAKGDVVDGIDRAARNTRKKGYRKGWDSFEILGRLDPGKVRGASCFADEFVKALL